MAFYPTFVRRYQKVMRYELHVPPEIRPADVSRVPNRETTNESSVANLPVDDPRQPPLELRASRVQRVRHVLQTSHRRLNLLQPRQLRRDARLLHLANLICEDVRVAHPAPEAAYLAPADWFIAARWRNSADTASTSARTASDTLRNIASAASAREVAGSNPVVAASSPDASAATAIVPADALDETSPRNISSARS